jgi:hypothetical protein
LLFALLALLLLLIGALRSEHPGFIVDKVQGGVLCTVILTLAFANCFRRYGIDQTNIAMINVATFILAATLAYKVHAGFFDRSVRFFINGPIVYGWICGFFCLSCVQLAKNRGSELYSFLGVFFLFATLWTQSKGPLLALFMAMIYLNMNYIWRRKLLFLTAIFLLVFIFLYNIERVSELLDGSRFSVILRLLESQTSESDAGSNGSRGDLIHHAISNIENNPIIGIGFGQFEYAGFIYPHNQHLEIATELGVPVFLLHLGFLLYAFLKSNRDFRSLMIFFSAAGLFSGDFSYLRFLYTFSLLGLILGEQKRKNVVENHD